MTNSIKAKMLMRTLYKLGIRELCLCAGARNSPLIQVAHSTKAFRLYHFSDERSAAFFALGRIIAQGRPLAVCTTSGTAAAELLPAVIEAHYAGLPLVAVTADRPPEFRGSGAPQVIEQVGLFSKYVDKCVDCVDGSEFSSIRIGANKPLHINICFSEPLIGPGDHDPWLGSELPKEESLSFTKNLRESLKADMVSEKDHSPPLDFAGDRAPVVERFIRCARHPVVIASSLLKEELPAVRAFLKDCPFPIYCEGTSGLREELADSALLLKSGSEVLDQLAEAQLIDGVLRLGGVPNHRFWRNLESRWSHLPVLSMSRLNFRGLSRSEVLVMDGNTPWPVGKSFWPLFKSAVVADLNPAIVTIDQHLENQLQTTLERWPHSEPSLFRSVIELIPSNSQVYVGNSLPIREWDLVAPRVRSQPIFASRGANGIDGQLSTFFGLARPEVENWCFVGDLTALYDLSAPWVLSELKEFKLRIVIINNGGGRIFQRLFAEEYYQNCHQLEFSHWAQMWNLAYQRWQSPDEINGDLPQQCVIELRPSFEESEKFWQNYP